MGFFLLGGKWKQANFWGSTITFFWEAVSLDKGKLNMGDSSMGQGSSLCLGLLPCIAVPLFSADQQSWYVTSSQVPWQDSARQSKGHQKRPEEVVDIGCLPFTSSTPDSLLFVEDQGS